LIIASNAAMIRKCGDTLSKKGDSVTTYHVALRLGVHWVRTEKPHPVDHTHVMGSRGGVPEKRPF